MSRALKRAWLSLLVAALVIPGPLAAQPIDYGSLQSLFGELVSAWVTGIPQRQSDVAANITIITAAQIRQTGGRSIPQVLARVPGTNALRSLDGGSTQGVIRVRGYTSLSGRVGYAINDKWTAALSGTNLSQNVTRESPFPAIQRLVLGTLSARF